MPVTYEQSSHTEDDDSSSTPKPVVPRPAPRSADFFHMSTDEQIAPPRRVELFALPVREEVKRSEDEDDEDEEDDSEYGASVVRHDEHDVAPTRTEYPVLPTVEIPLGPPQEFAAPLPLAEIPKPASHEDEDDQKLVPPSMFGRFAAPDTRFAEQRPLAPSESDAARPAEVHIAPESVVLAAAEQTVETVEPQTPEASVSLPPLPSNPNVAPPNRNTFMPTPQNPNALPHAGGNGNVLPPTPPNNGGGGGSNFFFNRMPPFGNHSNAGNPNTPYDVPPTPNAPNMAPQIIERETVVERHGGNFVSTLALIGLLLERRARKGADAKLDEKIKEQRKEFETQRKEITQQSDALRRQRRDAAAADFRTTQLENHLAERQHAAEVFAPAQSPEVVRPTTAEHAVVPRAEVTEEEPAPSTLEPEQRIRFDAWRGTVMRRDSAGREVVDTSVEYGQAYHQERQSEMAPQAPRDAQVPVGAAAQHATPSASGGIQLPGGFNPSLPSGMTSPMLSGGASYQDPEHLLSAPTHRARDGTTTVFLWLLVAILAFAIVSGARLLF